MRIKFRSDPEMSHAELSALLTLQRTGRLRFELSDADKRDGVHRCAEDFISNENRDVFTWVLIRSRLRKCDPAFATLSFAQAVEDLGTRRKPSPLGTAARWCCTVGAFGESSVDDAKAHIRDATAKRRSKAAARRRKAHSR